MNHARRTSFASAPAAFQSPFWAIFNGGEYGVALTPDLTYSAVLRLQCPASLDTDTIGRMAGRLRETLATLPLRATLQILYTASPAGSPLLARVRSGGLGFTDELGGQAPQRCHLALSLPSPKLSLPRRLAHWIGRHTRPGSLGITAKEHGASLRRLQDALVHVLGGLRQADIFAQPLRGAELRLVLRHPLEETAGQPISGRTAPALMWTQPSPTTFHCGGRLLRVVGLTLLPPAAESALLAALLLDLPAAARVNILFDLQDQEPVARGLARSPSGDLRRRRSAVTILLSTPAAREDALESLDDQMSSVLACLAAHNAGAVVEHEVTAIPQIIAALLTELEPHWIAMTAKQAAELISGLSGPRNTFPSDWR